VREQIAGVVGLFGKQTEAAQISMRVQLAEPLILRADQRLLRQVMLNVLSNALKFTARGGTVTLAAQRILGAGLEISVSDTGIGMSSADIETALIPFGQVDSTIARRFKGTGLGLPISRSLMRLHGGDLRLESVLGTGTRVIISLPESRLADPDASASVRRAGTRRSARK